MRNIGWAFISDFMDKYAANHGHVYGFICTCN